MSSQQDRQSLLSSGKTGSFPLLIIRPMILRTENKSTPHPVMRNRRVCFTPLRSYRMVMINLPQYVIKSKTLRGNLLPSCSQAAYFGPYSASQAASAASCLRYTTRESNVLNSYKSTIGMATINAESKSGGVIKADRISSAR